MKFHHGAGPLARPIVIILAAGLVSILTLAACDQSPIFYNISLEEARKDAAISGTPSRLAVFGSPSRLWAANGQLMSKAAGGTWASANAAEPSAFGKIRDLATTSSRLYVLSVAVETYATRLFASADGTAWTAIDAPAGMTIDSLHDANGQLFVGAHGGGAYRVYNYDGSVFVQLVSGADVGYSLVGAAYSGGNYYLATPTAGIFVGANLAVSDFTLVAAPAAAAWSACRLTGIIAIGNDIMAVGRGKKLIYKRSGDPVFSVADQTFIFTGALALWDSSILNASDSDTDTTPDLLLIGIQDEDNSIYGYRELSLLKDTVPNTAKLPVALGLTKPGSSTPTSVAKSETYDATLGIVPIMRLFQNSDGRLYASTYLQGLWLYSDAAWNAEE